MTNFGTRMSEARLHEMSYSEIGREIAKIENELDKLKLITERLVRYGRCSWCEDHPATAHALDNHVCPFSTALNEYSEIYPE